VKVERLSPISSGAEANDAEKRRFCATNQSAEASPIQPAITDFLRVASLSKRTVERAPAS